MPTKWEVGVQSKWETQDANEIGLPNAIRKLMNPLIKRICVRSEKWYGNAYKPNNDNIAMADIEEESNIPVRLNKDGSINVIDILLHDICKRLSRHFNIAFEQNEVKLLICDK